MGGFLLDLPGYFLLKRNLKRDGRLGGWRFDLKIKQNKKLER